MKEWKYSCLGQKKKNEDGSSTFVTFRSYVCQSLCVSKGRCITQSD